MANTPQKLAALMKNEFRFETDKKIFRQADYWQSPDEIWSRKIGDCEDYALFAQYTFALHHIEAYVISIYGARGYAHTVVVFKEGGYYNVINEDRLYSYQAKSIEEAVTRVNPYWIWGAFAEQKGTRGRLIRKIHNPKPLDHSTLNSFSEFNF